MYEFKDARLIMNRAECNVIAVPTLGYNSKQLGIPLSPLTLCKFGTGIIRPLHMYKSDTWSLLCVTKSEENRTKVYWRVFKLSDKEVKKWTDIGYTLAKRYEDVSKYLNKIEEEQYKVVKEL